MGLTPAAKAELRQELTQASIATNDASTPDQIERLVNIADRISAEGPKLLPKPTSEGAGRGWERLLGELRASS